MKNIFRAFHTPAAKPSIIEGQSRMVPVQTPQKDRLTVVELFQSQGCSSCPPANANILRIADDPNLLVLTYEVTYWDRLGWKDTFGNSAFDERQRAYARSLGRTNVFTPQVIVSGRVDGVGNNPRELQSLISQGMDGMDGDLAVEFIGGLLTVKGDPAGKGVVSLVRYDPRILDVYILHGENSGRNLPHQNIVRDVSVLGTWIGGSQSFSLPRITNDDGLQAAVLVQAHHCGPILGAARI